MKRFPLYTSLLLLTTAAFASAQQDFPAWEKMLRFTGGNSDATSVPVMIMGGHMQMTAKAAPKPGDAERAAAIAAIAKEVVAHYKDVNTALGDGYKPFAPTGKMGEEVHYSNYWYTVAAAKAVDYHHPGSILYKRTPTGMVAVGVMYDAPAQAGAAELDARAPLSIAPWHRHVDICGAPGSVSEAEQRAPGAKFGFMGSIHTEQACTEAGGYWIPLAFGWMTHVYPNEDDPDKVWGGAHMDMSADAD